MSESYFVIFGVVSVLQALVLPGTIILKKIKFSGSGFQKLVYAAALSLVTSYFLVVILVFLNIYKQGVLIFIFLLEILFLYRLFKAELNQPIYIILSERWKKFTETLQSLSRSWLSFTNFSGFVGAVLSLGAFILSASLLWWSIKSALHYSGTIFDVWDAVVSWNRWALYWANGEFPLNTRNYPQLIPANYSLSYVFMGSTEIQFFAKFIILPMAFFILGMPFDLGLQTKEKGFFFSTIITYLLLKKFLILELTNGYVDGTMAFFALLTVYTLIKISFETNEQKKKQLIWLGAIFAGSAPIAKQAGAYIFLFYLLWLYFGILKKDTVISTLEHKKLLFQSLTISAILALPWYIIKQVVFWLGDDRSEISTLVEVSSNVHYNVSLQEQIIQAISSFEIYLILFPVILLAFFLLKPLYRWLVVTLILPYPLLWAIIASYDTRNLSVFFPIFGLVAGIAFEKLLDWGLSLWDFGKLKLWFVTLIIVIALAAGLVAKFPNEVLSDKQFALQTELFSAKKNAMLYDLVEREGSDITIMTNYPMRFLPGFGDVELYDNYKNYAVFMGKLEANKVDYLFVPEYVFVEPQIVEFIDQQIAAGNYELVFEDKSWKYYKLLKVIR